MTIELDDTMESINEDDESMDPDWVKTPLQKWSRRKTTVSSLDPFNVEQMKLYLFFLFLTAFEFTKFHGA